VTDRKSHPAAAGSYDRDRQLQLPQIVERAKHAALVALTIKRKKILHKARMSAARYGLASKIAGGIYTIPPETFRKILTAYDLGKVPPNAFVRFITTMQFIARRGEDLSRKRRKGPILLKHDIWKNTRDRVLYQNG
jgi:hypothetical protein